MKYQKDSALIQRFNSIKGRRGYRKAVVALSRHIIVFIWKILKNIPIDNLKLQLKTPKPPPFGKSSKFDPIKLLTSAKDVVNSPITELGSLSLNPAG
jgi:hypothetical protein